MLWESDSLKLQSIVLIGLLMQTAWNHCLTWCVIILTGSTRSNQRKREAFWLRHFAMQECFCSWNQYWGFAKGRRYWFQNYRKTNKACPNLYGTVVSDSGSVWSVYNYYFFYFGIGEHSTVICSCGYVRVRLLPVQNRDADNIQIHC